MTLDVTFACIPNARAILSSDQVELPNFVLDLELGVMSHFLRDSRRNRL